MKSKLFKIATLGVFLLSIASCTTEGTPGTNGIDGKNGVDGKDGVNANLQKGNIVGNIPVYDQYGKLDLVNSKDIPVILTGVLPVVNIMTDAKGDFKFSDIPAATLSINITAKPGYVTYDEGEDENSAIKTFAYSGGALDFLMNNYGLTPQMLEIPKHNISAVWDENGSTPVFTFSPALPTGKGVNVVAFISDKATVSNTDYVSAQKFGAYMFEEDNSIPNIYTMSLDEEIFPIGSTIYVKFYTYNTADYTYFNENSGIKPIYPTVNTTGASAVLTILKK